MSRAGPREPRVCAEVHQVGGAGVETCCRGATAGRTRTSGGHLATAAHVALVSQCSEVQSMPTAAIVSALTTTAAALQSAHPIHD